jgi:O-antigen ligase
VSARVAAIAFATFFTAVQFFTSLQSLSPTPQFGYAFLGFGGAIVLAAAIVLAGVVCMAALVRDRVPIARSAYGRVALVWLGTVLLSSLAGIDPGSGLQIACMMTLCAAFGCALVRWYGLPGVARTMLRAYLAIGALAAVAGIVMQLTRVPHALYAASYGRASGFFITANSFAQFAEVFALVALGVALGARDGRMRVLAAVATCAGFGALALTFSRECYLGAAVALCFFAVTTGKRRIAFAIGTATVLAAAIVVVHPLPHHDPSDSFSRLRTLDAGLRVATLFPLTGVGPVGYFRIYPAIAPVNAAAPGTFGALHPHDVYVSLADELGLIGVCAATWGWLRIGRAFLARLRQREARDRFVPLGICAALLSSLISGIFDTIAVVEMTFVWLPYAAFALASADAPSLV